jgi:CRP-like cAMP-binding protein
MIHSRNRLLCALSPGGLSRISGTLTRRAFASHETLYESGAPIDTVFFVESGMVSVTLTNPEGETVEVAAVGRDGLVGVAAAIGFTMSPSAICYQISGEALEMPLRAYLTELEARSELWSLVRRYARARYVQMMQTILCNRCHTVEQRLARWLLMARDYAETDRFPLTQQVISEMLGVYRPAVTAVASMLQQRGLIAYERGVVTLTDVAGLEGVACSCYRVVRGQLELLLQGVSPAAAP